MSKNLQNGKPEQDKRQSSLLKALDFSQKLSPSFVFEDTSDRSYRNISDTFESTEWERVPTKRGVDPEDKRYP